MILFFTPIVVCTSVSDYLLHLIYIIVEAEDGACKQMEQVPVPSFSLAIEEILSLFNNLSVSLSIFR